MKRFRVRGVDIKSRAPVEFEAFEAANREDAVSKLNAAGIAASTVDEVEPIAGAQTEKVARPDSPRPGKRPAPPSALAITMAVAGGVLLAQLVGYLVRSGIAAISTAGMSAPTGNPDGGTFREPPSGKEVALGDRIRDNVYVYDLAWITAWEGKDGNTAGASVIISNRSDSTYEGEFTAQTVDASGEWLAWGEPKRIVLPPGESGTVWVYVTEYTRHSGKIAKRRVALSD